MEKIEISLLKSEIFSQVKEIEKIYSQIDERKKRARKSKITLESLAYQLHNLYCAFEDLFEIIARYFENQVEDIARYHKELLKRMSLPIEGVRPEILSEQNFKHLNELRRFRHFFRHAYAYEIEYEKLKPVLECAERLRMTYKEDIENFLKRIEA